MSEPRTPEDDPNEKPASSSSSDPTPAPDSETSTELSDLTWRSDATPSASEPTAVSSDAAGAASTPPTTASSPVTSEPVSSETTYQPAYTQPAYTQPTQPTYEPPQPPQPPQSPQPPAYPPAYAQPQPPQQPGYPPAYQAPPQPGYPPAYQPPYQQAPYQSAPGWGQPQAGWAPGPESYRYGSSIMAILAGFVLFIFGLIMTLGGIGGFLVGQTAGAITPANTGLSEAMLDSIRGVIGIVSIVVLVLGISHILSAIFIWAHRSWARFLGIILSGLFGLFGLLALVGSFGPQTSVLNGQTVTVQNAYVVPLIILISYGLALVGLIVGGRHFRKERVQ